MEIRISLMLGTACLLAIAGVLATPGMTQNRKPGLYATFQTNQGTIVCELYEKEAPMTVKNFVDLANGEKEYTDPKTGTKKKGRYYDGTIFHRVIPNFMIQGGGFDKDMNRKQTKAQIKNEAGNGWKNTTGTLAMARTNVVDSAMSQFFINAKDNAFLDHKDDTPAGFGYAVFGKVVSGMDVVKKIEAVKTADKAGNQNVPVEPVIIKSVTVVK